MAKATLTIGWLARATSVNIETVHYHQTHKLNNHGRSSVIKVTLLAMTATVTLMSGVAFAHAKLQHLSPADNALLVIAPKTLTLTFDEDVQLGVLKLNAAGNEIPVAIDRAGKASRIVTVTLPVLMPGKYEVRWSALAADDGHVTKGAFSFTVMGSTPMPH